MMPQRRLVHLGLYRSVFLVLSVAILTAGCEPAPSEKVQDAMEKSSAKPDAKQSGSARQILDTVAKTYSDAKTYEDVGEIYVEIKHDGKTQELDPNPFSLTFERPNRLRLHAFNVNVVVDGELLRATVPGIHQVLTLRAPPSLEVGHLLSDSLLRDALAGGISPTLPILRLLLGNNELPGFAPGAKVSQLASAMLGDVNCERIEARTDEGSTIYWIDPQTSLIKRIEFPTEEIRAKQSEQVEGLKVWADFKSSRVNTKIDAKAFGFEAPANAQLVNRFMPAPPQPPSPLLGQSIEDFSFEDLAQSGTVDRASLKGKVVVMDFWATWCGWCFRGFPNLQKVYDKYEKNEQVKILAVNTDEKSVDNNAVKKSFADAKISVPVVRDLNGQNEKVFGVEGLPTMVVLDGTGTVQYVHVGFDPNMEREVSKAIDELLAGKDLAKDALEKHEAERKKYEQEFNDALIGTTSTIEAPMAAVAEATKPSKFNLEKLWSVDITLPGNLLVVEVPETEPEIYVLSGSRGVQKVSTTGEAGDRIDLELPEQIGVSWLRTAVDSTGERYFVAFASTQQQLFLFDKSWKQKLAFPDSQHSGLSDVQFADLDGDGQLELLVGYWGVVGVQGVSLQGERKWSCRQLENVTRIAVSDPADDGRRFALCTNGRDFFTPVDHNGKAQAPVGVPGQSLYALFAADLNGGPPLERCALSAGEVGVLVALGLGADGNLQWNYPLPNGIHNQPVELVTPGRFPTSSEDTQGVWILAAPDSSLHILSATGELLDKFNYGEQLTGVGSTVINGKPTLLVASAKDLTAYQIEPSGN
jgi:thiol-disulfide isomerase/thioredoxin/outer membrane lipoprotein-sorting protein/outer membrane protein assembly factor BamB